jgi:pimeloyl-ACP methyl ester carboxylesterase
MRAFASVPFNHDELEVAQDAGYLEAAARYVPNLLNTIQQQPKYRGPTPDDPAVLGTIQAPVLVLHGSDTKTLMIRSVRHVADHVPNATVHQLPGAGHAGNLTHPERLAEALTGFFSPAQQPA